MLDSNSEKLLAALLPELARRVRLVISDLQTQGFNVRVCQGLRTFAEQDVLYSQGRSRSGPKVTNARGGQSNHNYGLAVDICLVGLFPFPDKSLMWKALAESAVKNGLEAGCNWEHQDKPHIQVAGVNEMIAPNNVLLKMYLADGKKLDAIYQFFTNKLAGK